MGAFHGMLNEHLDILRAFRGALVVCVSEETLATKALCPERWAGQNGLILQQDRSCGDLKIIEDVTAMPGGVYDRLLSQIRDFSAQCFSEDCIAIAEKRGWCVSVLVEQKDKEHIGLSAFICYRFLPARRQLCIYRLAVQPECRSRGRGGQLMRWMLEKAHHMPKAQCAWIGLSAVKSAIPFYERFGYVDLTCDDPDDPGKNQTWMEKPNDSIVVDPESEGTNDPVE